MKRIPQVSAYHMPLSANGHEEGAPKSVSIVPTDRFMFPENTSLKVKKLNLNETGNKLMAVPERAEQDQKLEKEREYK